MQRRDFIRRSLAAGAVLPLATGSATLFAAPTAPARVLVVFLRGGYDAASLLVPSASSFYYEQRPNIAIARPGTAADAALPLDGDWSLSPSLRESVLPLFEKKEAAFIPFAGTDDLSRSHFETQDSIELGQALQGRRDFQSGFMNRLASVLGAQGSGGPAAAIAFTDQLPLVFRGSVQIPNLALGNLGRPGIDGRQSEIITAMYSGSRFAGAVGEGFQVRTDATQALAGEMVEANRNAITAKGFEGEARRIGRLMRERYRLGFIDVGGWDTHVGQGNGTGYLANRLGELGKGLAAFAEESGDAWRSTVVIVVSEFGRTFKENGNRGTDHGHGSVYWALGGAVRGGRVAGEQVAVASSTLFQNRDYPVLNDYRAVLGGVFARLYDLSPAQVQQVFPGSTPKDLALV
jgi:uncharacterized protein (DUF1501 family)